MRVTAVLLAMACLWAAPAVAQTPEPMTLQPERLPGMCVTLAGSPGGASVSLPCEGAERQVFVMPNEAGGPIMQGDRCLAPRGTGYYPQLFAETCDGSPEQTWTINVDGEIRSAAGRCLSLMGQVSVNGTTVYGAECPKEGGGHKWKVAQVDVTHVVEASLESKARPGMCIGHDGDLWLLPCSDRDGQTISFDAKAMGQLRMKGSCFSGGYVFGGLGLGECRDAPAQQWVMVDGLVANRLFQCIEVVPENGRDVLRTTACTRKPEQEWIVRMPPAAK